MTHSITPYTNTIQQSPNHILNNPSYTHIDSTIITHNHHIHHLTTWLSSVNHTFNPTLIYRASLHGWTADDFHHNCNHKGSTLTIIKSTGGYIFGGYLDHPC